MMSQAMRKLAGNLNRTQTLCVFTNQIREKVGVMFGSPETQPGGRALKFYASQRLDIRRIETLKDGTEAVGNRVRVKVVKNKVAAPFKQAEFDIEFGKGISTSGCLLDYGIEHNIVTKSGSFFSYGDERLGQGRGNAKAFLDEHPEMADEIEAKVYEALGLGRDLVKQIEPRRGRRWPPSRPRPDGRRRARTGRQPVEPRRDRSSAPEPSSTAGERDAICEHERLQRRSVWPTRYLNRRERTVSEVRAAPRAQGHLGRTRDRGGGRAGRAAATSTMRGSRACSRTTSARSRTGASERIRRGLRARGIARDLVERALEGPRRRRGARARARPALALLRRRFPEPPVERRERDRALGILLRKGYESELALEALQLHAGGD